MPPFISRQETVIEPVRCGKPDKESASAIPALKNGRFRGKNGAGKPRKPLTAWYHVI
jgi:hypothetical protein